MFQFVGPGALFGEANFPKALRGDGTDSSSKTCVLICFNMVRWTLLFENFVAAASRLFCSLVATLNVFYSAVVWLSFYHDYVKVEYWLLMVNKQPAHVQTW